MAGEDPKIMQPGCRVENIVIVGLAFSKPPGEMVKPRLMAELIRRLCLRPDVIDQGGSVFGLGHLAFKETAASTAST